VTIMPIFLVAVSMIIAFATVMGLGVSAVARSAGCVS
jgi:hypothetical protein